MGRAKRVGAGTHGAGLAIEYVRSRKVVRLLGWFYDEPIEPVEIPLDRLCQELGIDQSELGSPRRFLLFAGSHHRAGGGLRDLAGTFDSEERAWEAFRDLRQTHPAAQGWAELAAIDGFGQVCQLAWFGLHPAGQGADQAGVTVKPVAVADHRRGARRRMGSADGQTHLRAVTPS